LSENSDQNPKILNENIKQLTVNRIAGKGVSLFEWIIPITSGKCPSRAPTKNSLKYSQFQGFV